MIDKILIDYTLLIENKLPTLSVDKYSARYVKLSTEPFISVFFILIDVKYLSYQSSNYSWHLFESYPHLVIQTLRQVHVIQTGFCNLAIAIEADSGPCISHHQIIWKAHCEQLFQSFLFRSRYT